jgi:S-DNA-T family DNA segregation ATPase FtsK/SpoIIIE
LFLFALIFTLSIFNQAGIIGQFIGKILMILFGLGKYVLPVLMMSLGGMYFRRMQPIRYALATTGMILFFLAGLGLLHLFYDLDEMIDIVGTGMGGGYIGFGIAYALVKLIGRFAGTITLFSLILIGFMLLFNLPVFNLLYRIRDSFKREGDDDLPEHSGEPLLAKGEQTDSLMQLTKNKNKLDDDSKKEGLFKRLFHRNKNKEKKNENKEEEENEDEVVNKKDLKNNIKSVKFVEDGLPEVKNSFKKVNSENIEITNSLKEVPIQQSQEIRATKKSFVKKTVGQKTKWKQPTVAIFEKSKGDSGETNVEQNIEIIQQTLAEFGIVVEPAGYNIGPTVTQYTFSPPPGVMLSKIVNLQSNLALSLASSAVRIEAPIPRTSLIGIEVPNAKPTMVRLGGMLEEEDFQSGDSHLTIALGKDVNGHSIIASLEKMPHVLVAGSTNTGKSISINVILSSLLFKNAPDDLKLILVDPKRVELSFYNGIPHLLTKVIVDMNKVVNSLKWATGEMDSRYKLLEEAGSKNIETYNEKVEMGEMRKVVNLETGEETEEPLIKMPYIVIVIDELADLMATHGKEVEALIVRLSQMARAVGIHLILSTQRPDTNVITGTIKNNIPARISFKVASQIDSRTILDRPGAEKLLGNGDMLYMGPGHPQPIRIQGPFVSEAETRKLIKYIKNQAKKVNFVEDENLQDSLENKLEEKIVAGDVLEGEHSDDDELYPQAKELVIQAGKASISLVQRKLRVGYNRAARIVDLLEENGVVGPENGSKAREVLIASEVMVDEVSGPEDDMEVQAERDKRAF